MNPYLLHISFVGHVFYFLKNDQPITKRKYENEIGNSMGNDNCKDYRNILILSIP